MVVIMNKSKYPWYLLEEPGDYFTVPHSVKQFGFVSLLVYQRNRNYSGRFEYECQNMFGESWVILSKVLDIQ